MLLTVTAIGVGAGTTVPGAIGAGGLCWACYSGFVLDRLGTLTLDRGGGQALLTMVLATAVASAAAGLLRWARDVAAERASAPAPLPTVPTASPGRHLETRRVQVIRPTAPRYNTGAKHLRWR